MSYGPRLADLIYLNTANMTEAELQRFRNALARSLPVVIDMAAREARAGSPEPPGAAQREKSGQNDTKPTP